MNWIKRHIVSMGLILIFIILAIVAAFFVNFKRTPIYGVSFDPDYARYLLPDAGRAYMTLLNEWEFRHIRLPVHWDVVEREKGVYDFSDIDWYVDRAGDVGAKVILSIGQKTPRWPECHLPQWTGQLEQEEYREKLLAYMAAVVEHYKNHPGLEIWQVENEPFLGFGDCKKITPEELQEEIALVKEHDPHHKVITSDSGELSWWLKTAQATDLFGMTVYRKVWNKYFGEWNYGFIPASYYRLRLWMNSRDPETAYVLELQAEPWITKDIKEVTPEELLALMSLKDIKKHLTYAENMGLPRVYLWGAEWWYWLKLKGYPEIADFIATLNKVP